MRPLEVLRNEHGFIRHFLDNLALAVALRRATSSLSAWVPSWPTCDSGARSLARAPGRLQRRCIRIAVLEHRFRIRYPVDQPLSALPLLDGFQIWPRQSSPPVV